TEAMVIVPCSMNTLAAVAHGIANNLVTRSAAVTLKEGRPLILVPRETPLTLIDLRNMTAIAEAGGVILPANPGFYHRPKGIEDLVGFVVQKIMDRLGLRGEGGIRWGEE
ncbi:UbiX family flavin prenyltransferase, partial [Candidatus Sumerlaeota bacterium]|nr:UbiX family flavin prenyltransferase [Candidatus Sumerlaeota bacterium]